MQKTQSDVNKATGAERMNQLHLTKSQNVLQQLPQLGKSKVIFNKTTS